MGNKPSVSEGEDDEDRAPLTLKNNRSVAASELTNGGGEDVDEELELPPPMKPIQEPILVATAAPPNIPGVPDIVENPCKRVSKMEILHFVGEFCFIIDIKGYSSGF